MAERLLRREHSRSCGRGLQAGTYGPRIEVAPFQPEPIDSAVQLYRARPDKDWSLTDCLSFVITERRHLTEAPSPDFTKSFGRMLVGLRSKTSLGIYRPDIT